MLTLGATALAFPAGAQGRRLPARSGAGATVPPAARPVGGARVGTPSAVSAPPAPIAPAVVVRDAPSETDATKPRPVISRVKLRDPVLVYYRPAAPSAVQQQLVMPAKELPLLKFMPLEELVLRRDVFIDGLGNYAPPGGKDAELFRLAGVSLLDKRDKRKLAPDGRSTYTPLKVPGAGELYVVLESADDYRHFVVNPKHKGAVIDFNTNGLPGVDSVRAAYTLRKMDASERGAGSGETIR